MATHRGTNRHHYQDLAVGLGWLSIFVGAAQILAPRRVGNLIGVQSKPGLVRLLGARGIATGIGILSKEEPANWMHAKVAGDTVDLTLLSGALAGQATLRVKTVAAAVGMAGITVLGMHCGIELSRNPNQKPIWLHRSITINRDAESLYKLWRNLEDLPDYMTHLQGVFVTGERTSHWMAKAPAGTRIEWDAEIVEDRPNECIAWRSLPGASMENSGSVTFEPATGNRGTVVRVDLEYLPPAGQVGTVVARIFGNAPGKQLAYDLLRFKQKIETGEVARTEGQPAGGKRVPQRLFDMMVRA